MDFEVLDEEQSKEFEKTCKARYNEIFNLIKNYLISRYTEEYLQAKLSSTNTIDDDVAMLTQNIIKAFGKYQKDKKAYICQSSVYAEPRKLKANFEVVCDEND
jgi:hypothetical protein